MQNDFFYGGQHHDSEWGFTISEIENNLNIHNVKVCHVEILEIIKIATALSSSVIDTSWVMNLDARAQKAYRKTVDDTAKLLLDIIHATSPQQNSISEKFGEIMVSMGSARALAVVFDHISLPIAELWKPQKGQNEGFDFHTICSDKVIHFGEAKYSAKSTPHGKAINQASDFINEEKHLRDSIHLERLACNASMKNLDEDIFGVIAAFSLNVEKPMTAFKNAVQNVLNLDISKKAKTIYLVGVSNGN